MQVAIALLPNDFVECEALMECNTQLTSAQRYQIYMLMKKNPSKSWEL